MATAEEEAQGLDGLSGLGDMAVVIVQEGLQVHLMTGVHISVAFGGLGTGADPLSQLLLVADRLFGSVMGGRASSAPPGSGYRTDGLWGSLPGLEHLPPGFVFLDDANPMNGSEDPPGSDPAGLVPSQTLTPSPHPTSIGDAELGQDYYELLDVVLAIEREGIEVEMLPSSVCSPDLSVPGQTLAVDGARIYAFVYADTAARIADSAVGGGRADLQLMARSGDPILQRRCRS